MTKRKNNNSIEEIERENLILETKVKHLTNDLHLTRQENETSTKNYFEIYSDMERKVEERTRQVKELQKQYQQAQKLESWKGIVMALFRNRSLCKRCLEE